MEVDFVFYIICIPKDAFLKINDSSIQVLSLKTKVIDSCMLLGKSL